MATAQWEMEGGAGSGAGPASEEDLRNISALADYSLDYQLFRQTDQLDTFLRQVQTCNIIV